MDGDQHFGGGVEEDSQIQCYKCDRLGHKLGIARITKWMMNRN